MGNGQDLASKHGKMPRLTLEGEVHEDKPFADSYDATPETWAYGLRNAWRCSFDMGGDHRLFCGDVQQNSFEEESIVGEGENLGWRVMKTSHCFDFEKPNGQPEACETSGLVMPIMEYRYCTAKPEDCKGISVTGGYVYTVATSRGTASTSSAT